MVCTAVIIGSVGNNYLVAHRRQIFKVAPEQLRRATEEEQIHIQSPQSELLGIKDMIEGGTFKGSSSNFIGFSLVSDDYPTKAPAPEGAPTPSGVVAAPASAPAVADASTPHKPEEGGDPHLVAMPAAEPPSEGSSSHDKPQDSPEIIGKSPDGKCNQHCQFLIRTLHAWSHQT